MPMSTADKIRKRKRTTADALEAAIEARGGRRKRKATPAPKRRARPRRKASTTARRRRPTPAQAVPSVSVDHSARLAEIERRMKEIMSSSTTPDRR